MPGRRWTLEEDRFVHAYFDCVGDYIGPHDLNRPKGSASARARLLRKTGAWDAISKIKEGERDYLRALDSRVKAGKKN